MEKRWYRRVALAMEVRLYCDGLFMARGEFRFPARVAHSTRRGAGLYFEKLDNFLPEMAFNEQ